MSRPALTLPLRLACLPRTLTPAPRISRRWLSTEISAEQDPPLTSIPTPSSPTPAAPSSKPLTPLEAALRRPLRKHRIPIQHLQHSTSTDLPADEEAQRDDTVPHTAIRGVVVSAGKMHKTVKVRLPSRRWEPRIGKVRTNALPSAPPIRLTDSSTSRPTQPTSVPTPPPLSSPAT